MIKINFQKSKKVHKFYRKMGLMKMDLIIIKIKFKRKDLNKQSN